MSYDGTQDGSEPSSVAHVVLDVEVILDHSSDYQNPVKFGRDLLLAATDDIHDVQSESLEPHEGTSEDQNTLTYSVEIDILCNPPNGREAIITKAIDSIEISHVIVERETAEIRNITPVGT